METLGKLKTSIKFKCWQIPRAKITVLADEFQPIRGSDLSEKFGITITQRLCPKVGTDDIDTLYIIKRSIAKAFPELLSRIGKSQHQTVNPKVHNNYKVTHQKRRIPVHLQPEVEGNISKSLKIKDKLKNCRNFRFNIPPKVIKVENDQSIKINLDSNILNKLIHKNNYQIPNIVSLIRTVWQTVSNGPKETADFTYARFTICV